MDDRNILALHDRIDEEHFDLHLLKSAVRALQQRVVILESQVRELHRVAFDADERRSAEDRGLVEPLPRRSRTSAGR